MIEGYFFKFISSRWCIIDYSMGFANKTQLVYKTLKKDCLKNKGKNTVAFIVQTHTIVNRTQLNEKKQKTFVPLYFKELKFFTS